MYLALFYLVLPCLAAIWARGMHARRRDGADGRSVFFPLLVISEQWNIRVFWVGSGYFLDAVSGGFLENSWMVSQSKIFEKFEPLCYASQPPCASFEGRCFHLPYRLALGRTRLDVPPLA